MPRSAAVFLNLPKREIPLFLVRLLGLAMILIAPWFYGGTPAWAIYVLSWCLISLSVLALGAWLAAGHLPRCSWVIAGALLLLAMGWSSALHPSARFDEITKLLFPINPPGGFWSCSVDVSRSVPTMMRLTGLVGLFGLLYDMAVHETWRRRLAWVLALSGVGVAAYGLLQKVEGDLWNYWQGRSLPMTVFAGFWYHGNAAAFLNLTWPFVTAAAFKSFVAEGSHVARAFWILASLLMLAAVLVNVSKAGHILLLFQLLLFLVLVLPGFLRRKVVTGSHMRRFLAVLLMGGVTIMSLALVFGTATSATRWEQFSPAKLIGDSRWHCARFCLSELPDAGCFGHGPGVFEAVFLDAGTRQPERVPPARWRHAHQDSLQTLLEWGLLGGGLWIALATTLLVQSWRGLWTKQKAIFSRRHATQAAAVTALTGIALHAQMDFPLQILSLQVTALAVAALGAAVPVSVNQANQESPFSAP